MMHGQKNIKLFLIM